MPTAIAYPRFEAPTACDDVPPPPLSVAVVYDEKSAYHAAMRLLADLLAGQASVSDVHPHPWRFDELRLQPWCERSLVEASRADLFVIATVGRAPLPTHVVEWLRQAFEGQFGQEKVVTVVYDEDNDPHYFGALCELLVRHETEAAGLHFRQSELLAGTCVR